MNHHRHVYDHWMLEHKRQTKLASCKATPKCTSHDTIFCLVCGNLIDPNMLPIEMTSPLARLVVHHELLSQGYTPVFASSVK